MEERALTTISTIHFGQQPHLFDVSSVKILFIKICSLLLLLRFLLNFCCQLYLPLALYVYLYTQVLWFRHHHQWSTTEWKY